MLPFLAYFTLSFLVVASVGYSKFTDWPGCFDLAGTKHKTMLEARSGVGSIKSFPRPGVKSKLAASTKSSTGLQNKTFYCETCDVHVNSETQLKQVRGIQTATSFFHIHIMFVWCTRRCTVVSVGRWCLISDSSQRVCWLLLFWGTSQTFILSLLIISSWQKFKVQGN